MVPLAAGLHVRSPPRPSYDKVFSVPVVRIGTATVIYLLVGELGSTAHA
jgi:hypothetical protein